MLTTCVLARLATFHWQLTKQFAFALYSIYAHKKNHRCVYTLYIHTPPGTLSLCMHTCTVNPTHHCKCTRLDFWEYRNKNACNCLYTFTYILFINFITAIWVWLNKANFDICYIFINFYKNSNTYIDVP